MRLRPPELLIKPVPPLRGSGGSRERLLSRPKAGCVAAAGVPWLQRGKVTKLGALALAQAKHSQSSSGSESSQPARPQAPVEQAVHRSGAGGLPLVWRTLSPAGAPWSDEEHKAFLNGLKMYGRVSIAALRRGNKFAALTRCSPQLLPNQLPSSRCWLQGQWKQISRYYVPSRTPTQVASHAQKHFLRQSGAQKRRSRFSAVEEAAMAAAVSLPAPPPLMPQQHASALPPPGIGVPSFFGQSLGSLTGASQPQHFRLPTQSAGMLGAAGAMQGGIAMGMPIGVLPPLPSITTACEAQTRLPAAHCCTHCF